MTKHLTRADILGKEDRVFQDVQVPEWEGMVRVQSLTGLENDEFEKSFLQENSKGEMKVDRKYIREKLLAWTCVDKDGKRLFSEGDIALLAEKNAAPLRRLQIVAQKLSGIGEREVEEIAKNSEAAQGGDSSLI